MNQYQKKVLIIIFSILILIAIVAIIWGVYISNNQVDPNIPPDDSGESGNQFTTDITVLNDYNEFFTVSKIINDYYLDLVSRDTDTILSLLDEDYKEEMGIQSNNVFRIIPCDYTSATYTPMEIYYNEDSIVTYYFVSGYLEDVDFIEDTSLYYEQINFLVMVNKNTRHYAITLLDNNLNIEDYAKSYK